jgi:hypothetical protein
MKSIDVNDLASVTGGQGTVGATIPITPGLVIKKPQTAGDRLIDNNTDKPIVYPK